MLMTTLHPRGHQNETKMDMSGQHPDRAKSGPDPATVIATVRKDAARRSAGYEAMFNEIAKTITLLSNHRLLTNDVQFAGLVEALIGIEDTDLLYDRILALVTYINRVAKAHGVAVTTSSSGPPNTTIMQQRPTNLADPDDELFQRTRLQVR